MLTNYSYVLSNNIKFHIIRMKNLLLMSSCSQELIAHSRTILWSLIINQLDSYFGISIVVDNPECNKAMLNVERPGV